MKPEFKIFRPNTLQDLAGIPDLMKVVTGVPSDWAAQLEWQYLQSPLGPPWIANALDQDGALLAHVAMLPVPPFRSQVLDGQPVFFSLNTAVRRDAPVPGLFPVLTRSLFKAMATEMAKFTVLGVANENSAEGFIRLLGFKELGPLFLGVLPPWRFPLPQGPRTLETSATYLRWRLARPGASVRIHPRSGQALLRMSHIGVPIDVVLSADSFMDLGPLVENQRKVPSVPAIRLYAFSGKDCPGAFPVPERLRPSPLRQIVKVFPPANTDQILEHLRATRFEFLDFDVV